MAVYVCVLIVMIGTHIAFIFGFKTIITIAYSSFLGSSSSIISNWAHFKSLANAKKMTDSTSVGVIQLIKKVVKRIVS